jgi:hypothetical protein
VAVNSMTIERPPSGALRQPVPGRDLSIDGPQNYADRALTLTAVWRAPADLAAGTDDVRARASSHASHRHLAGFIVL